MSALCVQYSRVAYKLGVMAYRRDWLWLAGVFLRQHLWGLGQSDLVATRTTNGCPNDRDYRCFEKSFGTFLAEHQHLWETGALALPAAARDRTAAPNPALLRQRRIMVIAPKYIMSDARYLENDFLDHLAEPLKNLGVETTTFFSDAIAYGDIFHLVPEAAAASLQRLREAIAETRPEILLIEANFVGGEIGLSREFLAEIKAAFGVKSVAVLGDAWGEYGGRAAAYWAAICDLVFHFAPGGDAERNSEETAKLFCSPLPVNDRNFHPGDEETLDISFSGSYGTYLRAFWFTVVKQTARRLALRSDIRTHQRASDCPSMAEYAATMRRSRMVINCSSRSPGVRVMTGRVWQALHAGVLLLEEQDEPTTYFFVPFVHYVPFENARQLAHMIRFFARHREWADRIGERAAAFCGAHYSAADIWARAFQRL